MLAGRRLGDRLATRLVSLSRRRNASPTPESPPPGSAHLRRRHTSAAATGAASLARTSAASTITVAVPVAEDAEDLGEPLSKPGGQATLTPLLLLLPPPLLPLESALCSLQPARA